MNIYIFCFNNIVFKFGFKDIRSAVINPKFKFNHFMYSCFDYEWLYIF